MTGEGHPSVEEIARWNTSPGLPSYLQPSSQACCTQGNTKINTFMLKIYIMVSATTKYHREFLDPGSI